MKIDRLVSIIMILLDKKRIGAKELSETFEVSLRTVYRDLETINLAGIPIRSTPGVGGGFEIMPEYKLDNKVFTAADLAAILTGLSGVSDMIRGEELINAIAKVKSFIPAEREKDITLRASQIHIDLSPWVGNRNANVYLDTVKLALQENRLLSFDYFDRYGHKTARTAEPYQLVLKGSHWYWQGFCLERNDFRLFRVSRMSNPRALEARFAPRAYQKPQLDIQEIVDRRLKGIRIRIHASIMDRVLDFCGFECFTPDGEEHYLVSFPFIENDFYYGILLSFGPSCECLEPAHVRLETRRKLLEMLSRYENGAAPRYTS